MERDRIVGENVRLLLNEHEMSIDAFAKQMGYSFLDAQKLLDGRLFVSQDDLEDIGHLFKIRVEDLMTLREAEAYTGQGFMHYMKRFNKAENEEKVRDIFDMYCDLKESIM